LALSAGVVEALALKRLFIDSAFESKRRYNVWKQNFVACYTLGFGRLLRLRNSGLVTTAIKMPTPMPPTSDFM
jgi:hypothetical protein